MESVPPSAETPPPPRRPAPPTDDQEAASAGPRWQYLLLDLPTDPGAAGAEPEATLRRRANLLTAQGARGWELVAVVPLDLGRGYATRLQCFFKRPAR